MDQPERLPRLSPDIKILKLLREPDDHMEAGRVQGDAEEVLCRVGLVELQCLLLVVPDADMLVGAAGYDQRLSDADVHGGDRSFMST